MTIREHATIKKVVLTLLIAFVVLACASFLPTRDTGVVLALLGAGIGGSLAIYIGGGWLIDRILRADCPIEGCGGRMYSRDKASHVYWYQCAKCGHGDGRYDAKPFR